ncbi:MAG: hypothetical protein JW953_01335 [Anaerolineae bacterium]|nr:hypothetical protein [Anaerolineae bacterium]
MKFLRAKTGGISVQSSLSSSTLHTIHQVGMIIGLPGLAVCGLVIWIFVLQIVGGIFLGILMASGESVLHITASPDDQITAIIVSDGCGITCRCTVRVDLKTKDQYLENIWRGNDVCDATVTWISDREFYILDDKNQQTRIDVRALGLTP